MSKVEVAMPPTAKGKTVEVAKDLEPVRIVKVPI